MLRSKCSEYLRRHPCTDILQYWKSLQTLLGSCQKKREEKRTLHIHALRLFPVLSHQGRTFRHSECCSWVPSLRALQFGSQIAVWRDCCQRDYLDSSHFSDPLFSESHHSFSVAAYLQYASIFVYTQTRFVRESVWFWVVNVSALPLSSCQVFLSACLHPAQTGTVPPLPHWTHPHSLRFHQPSGRR